MSAVGRGPASTTRSAAGSVRTGGTLSTLTADERGDLPVFCIGDRVLLEVQTLVGQQGFLGLDETVGSENPAFYETPPLSLLLNGMPDSRAKLPPAVDEIARKELPAAEGDDFDEEFYAENCVFELSAVAADGQGGLVVSHGSSRVFLKHVATSKYLAFTGEGATAQLVLKDPDPATAAPPPRSQLEIQPFFASRARGDHVQVAPPSQTHTHTGLGCNQLRPCRRLPPPYRRPTSPTLTGCWLAGTVRRLRVALRRRS